jgi:hypothetical protein
MCDTHVATASRAIAMLWAMFSVLLFVCCSVRGRVLAKQNNTQNEQTRANGNVARCVWQTCDRHSVDVRKPPPTIQNRQQIHASLDSMHHAICLQELFRGQFTAPNMASPADADKPQPSSSSRPSPRKEIAVCVDGVRVYQQLLVEKFLSGLGHCF